MSDFTSGTYQLQPLPGFSVNSSSYNIGGIPTTPNSSSVGFEDQSSGGGVSNVVDSLTGAASSIFHSFTNGISTVIGGVAQNYASYLSGGMGGQVVSYDRYGNPLYQVVDPRTGQTTVSASPAWPGSPGSTGNYLERTPPSYQTGGVWGWITNMLSLPAVTPQASIGSVPAPQQSFLSAPLIGGFSLGQIGLGVIGGFLVYAVVKKVT